MAFQHDSKLRARAVGPVVIGESLNKGTPYIEFYFEVTDGELASERVRWTGYFTEHSAQRTIEALQHCGWKGEDIGEFADGETHGLDSNEVQIVIEIESYEKDGESRVMPRVRWVNKLNAAYLNVRNAMDAGKAKAFGAKMRGLVIKTRAKSAAPDSGTDFPIPSVPDVAPPRRAAGAKKGW